MGIQLTIVGDSAEKEKFWTQELTALSGEWEQVVFVDGSATSMEEILGSIDRKGRAVFLLISEKAAPAHVARAERLLQDGQVDDVLVHPFRVLEVLSKLKRYQEILMWDEVSRINASFSELLERLHDDLKLAERLQKGKHPKRFPVVSGMRIESRYLAGMRSGGDHFDLAESRDKKSLSIVLTDSSSYGLSSSVLAVLMRVALKLSSEEARSSYETVRRIQEELQLTLGEKDRLSLFYGILSRKDQRLRYLNLGNSAFFYAGAQGKFQQLSSQGEGLRKSSSPISSSFEQELQLEESGRLVLLSDGFMEAAGGGKEVTALLDRLRDQESMDTLNELVFRVKEGFTQPDDMPEQDCSALVFDITPNLVQLN